ncbi:MAG: response regulator, partial [Dehalococcoidia bacterium]|nr:response regulator [Dehalococcoidia bacterium]
MPSEMGPRVLVVSEDEVRRIALASALRASGHVVEEAASVAVGCDVLRRRRVAAVVADVPGPEAGGLAITRAARRGAPPAGAIILLPARSEQSDYALPTLERDAFACLRHPVTRQHVVSTVAEAIEDYARRAAADRAAARAAARVAPAAAA